MSTTILAVVYAFHLVAAVVWVGGLAVLAAVVLPGARRVLDTPTLGAFLYELERRFTPWANLSLVALIATGMVQMSADENYGGLLRFDNTWAWAMLFKHLAVIGMALIASYAALVLEPERRRLQTLAAAGHPDDEAGYSLEQRRARLASLNLGCGLLTLVFTAIATAQ